MNAQQTPSTSGSIKNAKRIPPPPPPNMMSIRSLVFPCLLKVDPNNNTIIDERYLFGATKLLSRPSYPYTPPLLKNSS
jgi:hypothetical protein